MTKAEFPPPQPLATPALGEPYLLTPGPLTTSRATKEAMLRRQLLDRGGSGHRHPA